MIPRDRASDSKEQRVQRLVGGRPSAGKSKPSMLKQVTGEVPIQGRKNRRRVGEMCQAKKRGSQEDSAADETPIHSCLNMLAIDGAHVREDCPRGTDSRRGFGRIRRRRGVKPLNSLQ